MTKKNKKVLAIISILFVIIYILSSALIYKLSYVQEYGKFYDFAQTMMNYDNIGFQKNLTAVEYMMELTERSGRQNNPYYPFIAALYDADGEIVAQTGTYITIPIPDESGSLVNRKYKYFFIDELLSREKKKELAQFLKGVDYLVYVTKLDYYRNGDEILPVSVTVTDLNQPSPPYNRTITIDLYDKEITDTYEMEFEYSHGNLVHHNDGYNITFVNYDENSRYYKIYERLKEKINNYKEQAIEALKNGHGGGGSINNDCMNSYNDRAELKDGNYALLMVAEFDSVAETLFSNQFIKLMSYQTVFFVGFYLALIFLLITYYKRNKRLEDSKIAFTSAAAHELKTPLAVIENQCECILENIAPEKNNDYVKSIYSESLRMNKLVATLLQYNRLASAESIKKEKCDLTEIVKAEIEKYAPLMESKNIQLETSIAQSEIVISCNKDLIALVIDNYLSNAVKHTAEGKKIAVILSGSVNDFTLAVFNEGKNIKPELVKTLWDIFYRDDEARNSEDHSTGMGLAICKQILEHHKYKYGFTNKPDGVEFYFKNN